MGTPLRSEPVLAVPEIRLEDRLQHHLRGGLDYPIPHRRDPQRSLPSVCLRNVHSAHWLWPVSSLPQFFRQLPKEPLDPFLLNRLNGRAIHARCPTVGLHFPPRPRQEVLSVHLVVQRMEPPRRTRLRGSIQCPLELSCSVHGVVSLIGIHQPLPPLDTQTKCGPFPTPSLC